MSWFQPHAEDSLRFLQKTGVNQSAAITDVGGGASILVDDLLLSGHSNVLVIDFSEKALLATKNRLKSHANQVHWLVADITKATLPAYSVDVWRDRAVFTF